MAPLLVGALLLALQEPGQAKAPVPGGIAVSQETELDRRTRDVASGLRCPVCQGLSIADSPSDLAQEMKALVKEQLAAGKTPEAVRAYFIEKYGEWVLLEPKPTGMNLLVYALPVLVIVGGATFVWRFVNRHSEAKSATTL